MNNKRKNDMLPFKTITAASNGDVEAINNVLEYYEKYITVLSAKKLYDENGVPYLFVDEQLRQSLKTKLITALLKFKAS